MWTLIEQNFLGHFIVFREQNKFAFIYMTQRKSLSMKWAPCCWLVYKIFTNIFPQIQLFWVISGCTRQDILILRCLSLQVWASNYWFSYLHSKTYFIWVLNSKHGPKQGFWSWLDGLQLFKDFWEQVLVNESEGCQGNNKMLPGRLSLLQVQEDYERIAA